MNAPKPTVITVKPVKDDYVEVSWEFNIMYRQEENGAFSCYIPGFEFYFSAANKEAIDKKGPAMTQYFFDYVFKKEHKKHLKTLAIELHKRGFRTDKDALTMQQLVNNIPTKSKFTIPSRVNPQFKNASTMEQTMEMSAQILQ